MLQDTCPICISSEETQQSSLKRQILMPLVESRGGNVFNTPEDRVYYRWVWGVTAGTIVVAMLLVAIVQARSLAAAPEALLLRLAVQTANAQTVQPTVPVSVQPNQAATSAAPVFGPAVPADLSALKQAAVDAEAAKIRVIGEAKAYAEGESIRASADVDSANRRFAVEKQSSELWLNQQLTLLRAETDKIRAEEARTQAQSLR